MNKKRVAVFTLLLFSVNFNSNLNAQFELAKDSTFKKDYKKSIGYDFNLFVNGYNGGFVYRKELKKTTLKIGLYAGVNSHGSYYGFDEDIRLLTIPDTNNVFKGEKKSFDYRSLKLNVGIEKDFSIKERGCFFYGGDIVLGIQSTSNTQYLNEYKIESDSSFADQISFVDQKTLEQTINKTNKSLALGLGANFGYKYNLFKRLVATARIELESTIVTSYNNSITTTKNNTQTEENKQRLTSFNFDTNIWIGLNYTF